MKHHILIKWNELVTDKEAIALEAEALFQGVLTVPGVHSVALHRNVISRPNRYDLMLVITMDEAALPLYDVSEPHRQWKERYNHLLAAKAIFDCE